MYVCNTLIINRLQAEPLVPSELLRNAKEYMKDHIFELRSKI